MPESLTCPMSKCMILLQCLLILARHRWKKKKNSKLHPQEEAGSNSPSPHSKGGKKGRNISETQVLPGAAQSYSFVFYFNQKILPKTLGTIIYNNADKSQLHSTPHTSEPTVLALASLSKRQRINSQLTTTLNIHNYVLRRFGYSVCNSSTKHGCSHLRYLPRFPLQFNREK